MNLETLDEIDRLYTTKDCHFRTQVARVAIGALVQRPTRAMRQARPQALASLDCRELECAGFGHASGDDCYEGCGPVPHHGGPG